MIYEYICLVFIWNLGLNLDSIILIEFCDFI